MFKEHYRVRVFNRCSQQAFGIIRESGIYHFQTWNMKEPCLVALRMEWPCTHTCTRGHAHHYVGVLSPAPVRLGEVIDNGIKARRYKISKLHFNHALYSFHTHPQSSAQNARLAQRRISHPVFSELIYEAIGYFKHAAVFSYVLPHDYQVIETLHRLH